MARMENSLENMYRDIPDKIVVKKTAEEEKKKKRKRKRKAK